jgi:predicted aspartyl protease
MKIDLVNGLLQTSITLIYKGQTLTIDKVVIDTGASHTLLSADIVSELGVFFKTGDEIVNAFGVGGEESCFRKTFDNVQLGSFQIENFKLDIGTLHEKIAVNGLLGLDLLMEANIILDLSTLRMRTASEKN